MIKEVGNCNSLKTPAGYTEGLDPKVVKVWVPDFERTRSSTDTWMEDGTDYGLSPVVILTRLECPPEFFFAGRAACARLRHGQGRQSTDCKLTFAAGRSSP